MGVGGIHPKAKAIRIPKSDPERPKEGYADLPRRQGTYRLHCSSFLRLPYRILIIYLVKPKIGTSMETIGIVLFQGICRVWVP